MPIVTITRLFGAGGSDVAARAAGLLGWPLLDDALADSVAARLGLTLEEVKSREERAPSLAERVADTLALSAPEVRPVAGEYVAPPVERMLTIARKVMEDVAAEGPVVIVGRGAAAVFADRPDAIHVFCYAPRDALIRRVMSRESLPHDAAARRVYDTNRDRELAMRNVYHRDWRAVEHYHMCLNTAWLGTELAAASIARAARERL
jgi:cytidylate kinase